MVDPIILYEPSETDFKTNGLGYLKNVLSGIVHEEVNGEYILNLDYPLGHHLSDLLKKHYIIFCKPNPYSKPQPFRITDVNPSAIPGMVSIVAKHISYDLSGYQVFPVDFKSKTVLPDGTVQYDVGKAELKKEQETDYSGKPVFDEEGNPVMKPYSTLVNAVFKTNPGEGISKVFDYIEYCLHNLNNDSQEAKMFKFSYHEYPDTPAINKNNPENKPFEVCTPSSVRSLLSGKEGTLTDVYNGEYYFDGFNVKLCTHRGRDNDVVIQYGHNLTDLKYENNIENDITGIIPYVWNDSEGLCVLTNTTSGGDIGTVTSYKIVPVTKNETPVPYQRIVAVDFSSEFKKLPSQSDLEKEAINYIKNHKLGLDDIKAEVSFIDLTQTDEYNDLQQVHLGDTVTVYYSDMNINIKSKCIATDYDIVSNKYTGVQLGNTKASMSEIFVNESKNLEDEIKQALKDSEEIKTNQKDIAKDIDKKNKDILSLLVKKDDEFMGGNVVIWNNNTKNLENPNEILIIVDPKTGNSDPNLDWNSPDKAVRKWIANINGVGYIDKEGTLKTAMSKDGWIIGDRILGKSIQGSKIAADTIESSHIKIGSITKDKMSTDVIKIWDDIGLDVKTLKTNYSTLETNVDGISASVGTINSVIYGNDPKDPTDPNGLIGKININKANIDALSNQIVLKVSHEEVNTLMNTTINSIEDQYLQTDSSTVVPNKDDPKWNKIQPQWINGKYIWKRTIITKNDINKTKSYTEPVCISGSKGEKGDIGETGAAGQNGQSIVSILTEYNIEPKGQQPPEDEYWKPYHPGINWNYKDNDLWSREKITYKDPDEVVYTKPRLERLTNEVASITKNNEASIKIAQDNISSCVKSDIFIDNTRITTLSTCIEQSPSAVTIAMNNGCKKYKTYFTQGRLMSCKQSVFGSSDNLLYIIDASGSSAWMDGMVPITDNASANELFNHTYGFLGHSGIGNDSDSTFGLICNRNKINRVAIALQTGLGSGASTYIPYAYTKTQENIGPITVMTSKNFVFCDMDSDGNRINGDRALFYLNLWANDLGLMQNMETASDVRIKENIKDTLVNGLDVINKIEVKQYDRKDIIDHKEAGLIAQQLREVSPELVGVMDERTGLLGIRYQDIIPYLIKAVQEIYQYMVEMTGISTYNITDKWIDPYTNLQKDDFCKMLKDDPLLKENANDIIKKTAYDITGDEDNNGRK